MILASLVGCSGMQSAPHVPPNLLPAVDPGAVASETELRPSVQPEESLWREVQEAADPNSAWLGVELAARHPAQAGVLVRRVVRGSPAARAGLKAGDVITSLEGEALSTPSALQRKLADYAPGHRLSIAFARAGRPRLLAAELARFPAEEGLLRLEFVGTLAPLLQQLQPAHGLTEPNLRQHLGRVVLLEFSAPWCVACAALSPSLNRWANRYGAEGLDVIGVMPEPVAQVAGAARQLGMQYPVLSDASGVSMRTYGARAVPTLFLIDRAGIVRDVVVGYATSRIARLETSLLKLLTLQ